MENCEVYLRSEDLADPKGTLLVCMGRDGVDPPFAYLPNKFLISKKGKFKDGIETISWVRWQHSSKSVAPWVWNRLCL